MSIKKFQEKYSYIHIRSSLGSNTYLLYMNTIITVEVATLNMKTREYLLSNRRYSEELMDDIRLLYKYLLKEYKKREELKRKREENESTNQPIQP